MYGYGYISEVDAEKGYARVKIDKLDGITSDWLQIIYPATKTDSFTWTPSINEFVVCLFDEFYNTGVILGAVYTESNSPANSGVGITGVTFEDGTKINYNKNNNKLTIDVGSGDVVINCNSATITAIDSVNIESPNLNVSGNVNADGDVIAGNITPLTRVRLLTHTHTSPVGPTGPPTPTP